MVLFYAELAIVVRINAKMHDFARKLKFFWGGGTAPSPGATPIGEGNTPPKAPPPRCLHPIFANPAPQLFFSQFSHCTLAISERFRDRA